MVTLAQLRRASCIVARVAKPIRGQILLIHCDCAPGVKSNNFHSGLPQPASIPGASMSCQAMLGTGSTLTPAWVLASVIFNILSATSMWMHHGAESFLKLRNGCGTTGFCETTRESFHLRVETS
jgi:hypothetical protein